MTLRRIITVAVTACLLFAAALTQARSADENLFSFNGPDSNGQSVYAGTADASSGGYASALKFSTGLRDFTIHAEKAVGGRDACVDVNNLCRALDITVDELWPTGQFAATLKGGSQDVILRGRLMRHASKFDVIIGDWSDQSHEPTIRITLAIIPADGQPVVVCVLKGARPIEKPGTGPYVYRFPDPDAWYHDLCVFGFETLRRWGFWRAQAN